MDDLLYVPVHWNRSFDYILPINWLFDNSINLDFSYFFDRYGNNIFNWPAYKVRSLDNIFYYMLCNLFHWSSNHFLYMLLDMIFLMITIEYWPWDYIFDILCFKMGRENMSVRVLVKF